MPEKHDIFVRAHTVVPSKKRGQTRQVPKWPERVLVFDTETTLDTSQKLTIGAYRICELSAEGYQCIEEGLFYGDSVNAQQRRVLDCYVADPKNLPAAEVEVFPPPTRLKLKCRSDFVERVVWKAVRNGAVVVGFNLPFDISRLAAKATPADKGGWSLVLSLRKNRKTQEMEPNPERPRVVITSLDSKMAFIGLSSIRHPEEWSHESRFLDLHTLGRALRDQSYSLERACQDFRVRGKMKHKPTGRVTVNEVKYCRQDVRATSDLLNAMKREFDGYPIELRPDRAYSPASLVKAYLAAC